jgi:hypothetical protein
MLINRNEKLEPLDNTQIWEEHEVYLHTFKQAKETIAKALAIQERLSMLGKRKQEERKQGMSTNAISGEASNAMNSVRNQAV